MPRIAEINLTKGHQFFQKEKGDISALLCELEEGLSAVPGDGDTEDSPFATTGRGGGKTRVRRDKRRM